MERAVMSDDVRPEILRRWMRNFLVKSTGDNASFFQILERPRSVPDDAPLSSSELDRARVFRELISGLTSILGTEEAVGTWLTHSVVFNHYGDAAPIDYFEGGGFWALSLLTDIVKIAKAHPTDPLGLRDEVSFRGRGPEEDFENYLDLIPAAWNIADVIFEKMIGVETGFLDAWRNHDISVTEEIREPLRRIANFHETLRLHVAPRGYADWWRRSWSKTSPIGARSPLEVWSDDGWDGLDLIARYFWAQC
jgi:hypothetical protein